MIRNLLTKVMLGALLIPLANVAAMAQAATTSATTTQVAADPGGNQGGPEAVWYDGKGSVWIANQFHNSVSQISTSNGALVATYAVGAGPVALASDGKSLWIANLRDNTVVKLNTANGNISATFSVPGGPGGLAWDGSNMWVTCRENNTVVKLTSAGIVATTVTVGRRPLGIAYDSATATVWVANNLSDTVTKLAASDGATLGTFATGRGPFGVLAAFGSIFVSNFFDGTLTKLSPDGLTSTSIAVGDGAAGMTADTANVWVANNGVNTVAKLNAATGAVSRFPTGRGPFGVVLDGTGAFWTSNFSSGTVSTSKSAATLIAPVASN